jgi:hypothetical protein
MVSEALRRAINGEEALNLKNSGKKILVMKGVILRRK